MAQTSGWMGLVLVAGWLSACADGSSTTQQSLAAKAEGDGVAAQAVAPVSRATQPSAVAQPVDAGTKVFVNGRELAQQQAAELVAAYGNAPPPGRYWYDTMSGAWGLEGRETAGFIQPGHDFGPVAQNASNGDTGVVINGREITMSEAVGLQRMVGAVYAGRWWLDGRTGNFGVEGNPLPIGNLVAMMRAQSGGGGGGDNFWSSATARGNSSGGCSYVNVGGTTVTTSGCD